MRLTTASLLSLVVIALALGASAAYADNEPFMFRFNPQRTGVYQDSSSEGSAGAATTWRFETGGAASSPVLADGVVYVASRDGHLYALEEDTGEEVWRFDSGEAIAVNASSVISGDTVYTGNDAGTLFALDRHTGELMWEADTNSRIGTSAAIYDGIVIMATASAGAEDEEVGIHAFNAADGERLWYYETSNIYSTPGIAKDTIFVADIVGTIYALDIRSGEELWSRDTGYSGASPPAIVDGTVYMGGGGNRLFAFDVDTGDQQWAFEASDGFGFESGPVVVGSTVYAYNHMEQLYAVNADTGEALWKLPVGRDEATPRQPVGQKSTPAVRDGMLYMGDLMSELYAINLEQREIAWTFETPDWTLSSPAITEDRVFFSSLSGDVYSLDRFSGEPPQTHIRSGN